MKAILKCWFNDVSELQMERIIASKSKSRIIIIRIINALNGDVHDSNHNHNENNDRCKWRKWAFPGNGQFKRHDRRVITIYTNDENIAKSLINKQSGELIAIA